MGDLLTVQPCESGFSIQIDHRPLKRGRKGIQNQVPQNGCSLPSVCWSRLHARSELGGRCGQTVDGVWDEMQRRTSNKHYGHFPERHFYLKRFVRLVESKHFALFPISNQDEADAQFCKMMSDWNVGVKQGMTFKTIVDSTLMPSHSTVHLLNRNGYLQVILLVKNRYCYFVNRHLRHSKNASLTFVQSQILAFLHNLVFRQLDKMYLPQCELWLTVLNNVLKIWLSLEESIKLTVSGFLNYWYPSDLANYFLG